MRYIILESIESNQISIGWTDRHAKVNLLGPCFVALDA